MTALSVVEEVAAIWANTVESGGADRPVRELFKQRGFEYSDDVSQTSKGKWGNEYAAIYENQKLDIAPHITLGAKQIHPLGVALNRKGCPRRACGTT
ncbi:hypothetical protein QEK78_003528 [Stenotrophomonas maltophilia]|nr:hypothetical protein [Stenotrophomonas maltophilia]